jgi:hypothetical protein
MKGNLIRLDSSFRLPVRYPIWKYIRDFEYPDWTEASQDPLPSPPMVVPKQTPPNIRLLEVIKLDFSLKNKVSLPFKKKSRENWLKEESEAASTASLPVMLEDFIREVPSSAASET